MKTAFVNMLQFSFVHVGRPVHVKTLHILRERLYRNSREFNKILSLNRDNKQAVGKAFKTSRK